MADPLSAEASQILSPKSSLAVAPWLYQPRRRVTTAGSSARTDRNAGELAWYI